MNAERLLQLYDRVSEAPDAVPRLRRFILDLAMRGKLVQQDPNDEPALKDVFQARMVSNNTPRKKKTKRGEVPTRSSNTPPFLLPKQWAWTKFGRLHDLIRGVTYSKSDVGEGAGKRYIPVLRANNIGVTLNLDNPVYVRRERISEAQLLRRGDFMIALSSGSKNLVGKAAYVPEDLEAAFGGFCGVIRLHDHQLEDFVRIYLKSDLYRKSISEGSRGIGINNLKKDVLASTAFPLPPRAEQNRIVAKVDELMSLCDSLGAEREKREATRNRLTTASLSRLTAPDVDEKQFKAHADFAIKVLPDLTTWLDQIKLLRRAILDLAVRGKLVEQDLNDEPASFALARIAQSKKGLADASTRKRKLVAPAELTQIIHALPVGWSSAAISELVRVINGRAYKQSELLESGTPVLRVGNLFTSKHWYYSDLELEGDKYCDNGDLIYAWSASFGPFFWDGPRAIFHYHIWKLSLFSEIDLCKRFLYYFLLQKTELIKGSGHGISMVHMTKEKMEQIMVPFPPLTEQRRIVARVDELMTVCDGLERDLISGQKIRTNLLEALLSGALEPTIRKAA